MDQSDGQASMVPVDWDLNWSLLEGGEDFSISFAFPIPEQQVDFHTLTCGGLVDVHAATTQQVSFVALTNSAETLYGFDGALDFDQHQEHSWILSPGRAPSDLEGVWNQAQWPLAPQAPWGPPSPENRFAMADSLPVSHSKPDQGGSQEASLVPASSGTSLPEANHTTVKPRNVPMRELLPAEPGYPSSSQMKEPVPSETRTRYLDLPSTAKTRKTAPRPKPRLPCTYPGCSETFPRPYEHDRHLMNVHQRQTQIFCSVFECDRNSNPIHRVDKFYEHIRKVHTAADSFLCIVESCRQGPFSRDELVQHLNAQHPLGALDQSYLEESLNALNLGSSKRKGLKILVDVTSCPLKFLGCDYFASPRKDAVAKMLEHVRRHDLLQRSRGYKSIVQIFGYWDGFGAAKCPICKKVIGRKYVSMEGFISHVIGQHDKESRCIHALELEQTLRPFITRMEDVDYPWKLYVLRLIAEFREAGVI